MKVVGYKTEAVRCEVNVKQTVTVRHNDCCIRKVNSQHHHHHHRLSVGKDV